MPAIPVHHTAVVDEPWDANENVSRIPNDAGEGPLRHEHAYVEAGADPALKGSYKFPHHMVSADGTVGAANMGGCRNGMSRMDQADVPEADHDAIEAHLQAHMKDGGAPSMMDSDEPKGASSSEPPAASAEPAARRYGHILHAVHEHPWAMTPQMLSLVTDILDFRAAGGLLSADEIQSRIAAADNGPRQGGQIAGGVAVIPVYGMISQRQSILGDTSGGTSCEAILANLRDAVGNPDVKAVVLDVDSPGGDVAGVPELAADIRALRAQSKPIVAVANTLMASAAYWLCCQADEIVASPSAMVGSIGIVAMHDDISGNLAQKGVKTTLISAGAYKTEGNEFEPLTDEARTNVQGQVDAFYSMFIADVARGRSVTADKIQADFGQGRVLMAAQASRAGMVDRVDTLENTVKRLSRGGGTKSRARAEFADRTLALEGEAVAIAAHATERARLRAKEGRPALSATTSSALRSARDAMNRALATVDPTTSGSPLDRATARMGSRSQRSSR